MGPPATRLIVRLRSVRATLAAFGLAVSALLAGCGQVETGTPEPARGGSAQAERLAPPVPHPKDACGIPACELLTPEQLTQLGVSPATATEESSSGLTTCSWESPDKHLDLSVTPDANRPQAGGLNDTYLKRSDFEVFEPTEVAGHPAVRADYADVGDCPLYVGVADTQAMIVAVDGFMAESTDTCPIAREATAMILSNLPPLTRPGGG